MKPPVQPTARLVGKIGVPILTPARKGGSQFGETQASDRMRPENVRSASRSPKRARAVSTSSRCAGVSVPSLGTLSETAFSLGRKPTINVLSAAWLTRCSSAAIHAFASASSAIE
jgi:hypothetical protein